MPDEFSLDLGPRICPNEKPLEEASYRIAIVGEAPGEDEYNYGRPFVGKSGTFLTNLLREVGIQRQHVFMGNVSQVRPAGNNFDLLPWEASEIQNGIRQLSSDIAEVNPNIILLLGNAALHLARCGNVAAPRAKGSYDWPNKITNYRGSLFRCYADSSPFCGRKCISSLHPAYVLRDFTGYPLLKHDLKRCRAEAESTDLTLPQRELRTTLSADSLCSFMDSWPSNLRCSIDIEGGLDKWPCVSLSDRPSRSTTIAWLRLSEYDHGRVLQSFTRLMARSDVPKVLQNGLYDNFVLAYGYGILIRNLCEDTMIKGWEIFAELPRALSVQASIWTREPFWKDDAMYSGTSEGLYKGCANDSAVTLEICNAQDGALNGTSLQHYQSMMEVENAFMYMQMRGIRYDTDNVKRMLEANQQEIKAVGDRLQHNAGIDLRGATSLSSKKLATFLYTTKGYPPQYKKEGNRKTDRLTTDEEALLTLGKHLPNDPFIKDILRHRHLEGVRETLQITGDPDQRVRCRYSLEAETGRVKCYKSPTGSGANMQTIQSALRLNYIADPDYEFFQCDLEGADGWTVAAHCARLGDRVMLEDYLAGMKPAKILALLYIFGGDINKLSIEELKWAHDKLFPPTKKIEPWLYMGCKRVYHGTDYLMGIPTMQKNVLHDSFKETGIPVYMEYRAAKILQQQMLSRYTGVTTWHQWAQSELCSKGTLTSASGHTRIFFGRRFGNDIQDTLRQFLAHEPQNNTTWATNLAALRLWKDPGNRIRETLPSGLIRLCDGTCQFWAGSREGFARLGTGSLLIEPLHQVHDALCGQWPKCLRSWAIPKIREYFNNQLTIAGTPLVIPFSGGYGRSWGEATNPL